MCVCSVCVCVCLGGQGAGAESNGRENEGRKGEPLESRGGQASQGAPFELGVPAPPWSLRSGSGPPSALALRPPGTQSQDISPYTTTRGGMLSLGPGRHTVLQRLHQRLMGGRAADCRRLEWQLRAVETGLP